MSWLNTNTALARFAFVSALLANKKITDVPGETATAAYDRAYVAAGRPWLADGTESDPAQLCPNRPLVRCQSTQQRQLALRALMLAGPDAQVM